MTLTSVSGDTRRTSSATALMSERTAVIHVNRVGTQTTRRRTCRRIYVRDGDELVCFLLESSLDVRQMDGPADLSLELVDLGPVCLQAEDTGSFMPLK